MQQRGGYGYSKLVNIFLSQCLSNLRPECITSCNCFQGEKLGIEQKIVLGVGDPCPLCRTVLEKMVSRGKDTGNLICVKDWSKWSPLGERVFGKKKKVRYGGSSN